MDTGETVNPVALIEAFGPVHSPVTSGSRGERVRQLWWHFRRLSAGRKLKFIWQRLTRAVGRKLPGHGAAAWESETAAGVAGGRHSYLSGPYRARPIPGTLDVIRMSEQPDWFRRFGGDAPDLGWAGFAKDGVRVSIVAGARADLLRESTVRRLADVLRTVLGPFGC